LIERDSNDSSKGPNRSWAIGPGAAFVEKTLAKSACARARKQEWRLHTTPPEGYFMANHGTIRRAAVKRAVARRTVKRAVARRAVKRAVGRRAVKRAVARRAIKRTAVRRALLRRAVARRAVKRAVARRTFRRAFGRRALRKAALRKLTAADLKRMSLGL